MILVVGGTGYLGGTVVEELICQGKPVRCLVRKKSDTMKLIRDKVELIYGDVREKESLKKAVDGVSTVISSFATRIMKEQRVSALWETDYAGNLALIRLAKEAGVKKYIFVSYWGLAKFGNFEHGRIKKLVEDLLMVSGLDYTVFRVTTLATDMSILLGSRLKRKGWVPLFMKRYERVRPILLEDLAWCMVDAIENLGASCRTIEVAGEEEYTFLELQELFRRILNRKVRFIFIPLPAANFMASLVDFFTDNAYNAKGLVSAFTGGSTCDITEMKEVFRIKQGSFAKHLEDYLKTGSIVRQEPGQG
ncbi:MAG: NAD-dependent epimerase/dehydratase family protein [Nitrospira sp.]|nr:NAD-dependent epimerase/dehydratase family protein [Nitrospira sp.]